MALWGSSHELTVGTMAHAAVGGRKDKARVVTSSAAARGAYLCRRFRNAHGCKVMLAATNGNAGKDTAAAAAPPCYLGRWHERRPRGGW